MRSETVKLPGKKLLYVQSTGLAAFLIALVILQLYFLWKNEVVYEGTDNITHFHMARYAIEKPHLFLHLWGKPVFTTLLVPFTFLGFKGAQLFNLFVAVLTLIFTFKISKSIYPKGALAVVVLAAFAPVYFMLMLSTLTEILFSFVLVVSVYLFMKNKLVFTALLLSFIPFVRSEGIILFPVFAVAFALKRNWYAIPALAAGTVFYSVIGFFVFDDFLWLINRFPYPTGSSVYGSGELLHFVNMRNQIFGLPLVILSLVGLIFWMFEIFRKFSWKSDNLVLFIIIAGSWTGYFAAHSFVWWQGMGGSLGLIRVIGAVIPLAALTGTKGIQLLAGKIRNQHVLVILLGIISVAQVYLFFRQKQVPLKASPVDKLIMKSADFLKNEKIEGRFFYFNPAFAFHLGLNPYDSGTSGWFFGDKIQPSNSMEFGDILIWDAHFGPNEGGVSYKTVENDPWLQKIKTFLPDEKITVLGGYNYEIHIYRKEKHSANQESTETLIRELEIPAKEDGSKVLEIGRGEEYSSNIIIYLNELQQKDIFDAEIEIQFKSSEKIEGKDVLLVFSVENGTEVLNYNAFPLEWLNEDSYWKTATFSTRFAADMPQSAQIKLYVWNRGRKHLFIQTMQAKIKSE